MSLPEQITPKVEELQQQILDTLTLGHETLDVEHDKLKADIENILDFMGNTGKYVYALENEPKFTRIVTNLATALSVVDMVISEEKKDMFRVQAMMPETPIVEESKEEKSSNPLSGLFGKSKRIVRKTDPYESLVPEINKKLNKSERLEKFIEMYYFGRHTADTLKPLAVGEQDDALDDLLWIHKTIFPHDMAYSIIKIHKNYIELRKARERNDIKEIGISYQRDLMAQQKEMQKFGMMQS